MKFKSMLATLAVALIGAALLADDAEAGPFRRRTVTTTDTQVCTADGCGNVSKATEHTRTVTHGRTTATAQGVAEIQAAECSCRHHGGNSSYEGVGMGMSPQAALANCCSNGRPVVDEGVARGRDGRWYACRRYSR